MNTLFLLLTIGTTLVLQSGSRIAVDGPVREENGFVYFRSAGTLYSLNAADVLRIERATPQPEPKSATKKDVKPTPRRLRVSDEERRKILEELEKNHSGTPTVLDDPPPPPSKAEVQQLQREEWDWRRDARAHEEAVRRAREELQLLENRIEQLRSEIHSFVSQGYKARQFTYQTTELVRAQERLPYAQLALERARRAQDQFLDDARRMGILPGWLR
jgi:hypothetical protein